MIGRLFRPLTVLVIAALVAAACASAAPGWTVGPSAAPRASGAGAVPGTSAAPGSPAAAGTAQPSLPPQSAVGGTIVVKAYDLGFDPSAVKVPAPGTYAVNFQNTGAIAHDITFDDGTHILAAAGQAATGTVTIPSGGLGFICSIPGHADAGMRGAVTVDQTAVLPPSPGSASAAPGGSPETSPSASMPASHGGGPPHVAGVDPDPNAPAYRPLDATAPAPLSGTVHDIDLTITEGMMTVAPGYVVNVWTFGGTVPGPVIRVTVGDTVRIHLKNPATNTLSHSIDFHASQVAWNDEMTSIAPGEEKLYEWTADYAGVWMYHCGTAPALHHIANGMYGMVIVDPKGGLPKVDNEYALVQSEWYISGQGMPASLAKAAAGAPSPDFVVWNGVFNQYADHPLTVPTNGTARFFVLDAGPDMDSSFHIVGTIFNRVIKEGVIMDASTNGGWASQAVDLSPAQGAIIETSPKEDGLYPIVTHAFNFVGLGALGLLKAGDGDPKN